MHLIEALRREKAKTGRTLTYLVEEALAARLGISMNPDGTYPAHKPKNHVLNEG